MRYIYLIRNLVNHKVYVGQTCNPSRRRSGHFSNTKKQIDHPFYRSIQKHGVENFSFEVIEECSDDQIDDREIYWITYYDSCNREFGYNIEPGGRGITNKTRKKLSDVLKGNKYCVGRAATQETREKLKKCWRIVIEKRLGTREEKIEKRTCLCGNIFEILVTNRKYRTRKTCSSKCAHVRIHTSETKEKVRKSLKKFNNIPYDEIKFRISQGDKLIELKHEFNVSYTLLKKLKKQI